MKQLLAISILLFIFVSLAYAPDVLTFKVCVLVNDDDKENKTEKSIIESHLKRELRALGNVVIVDKEDDWVCIIRFSILGHTYKDGTKAPGISIAYSTQVLVPKVLLNTTFDPKWPIMPVWSDDPGVAYWTRDKLPSFCIQAANNFSKLIQGANDLSKIIR